MKLILIIFFLSLSGVFGFFLFINLLVKKIFYLPRVAHENYPQDHGLSAREILLKTIRKRRLQVWQIEPVEAPQAILVAIHGWANTSSIFLPMAARLNRNYRWFLVNTRNHGESDMDGAASIVKFKQDLQVCLNYIFRNNSESLPVFLIGHSLGAAASILTAAEKPEISGVVSIASFANLEQLLRSRFLSGRYTEGLIRGLIRYLEFMAEKSLYELSPVGVIDRVTQPMMLLHGGQDQVISPECLPILLSKITHPNVIHHLFKEHTHSSLLAAEPVIEIIDEFITNFLKYDLPVQQPEQETLPDHT